MLTLTLSISTVVIFLRSSGYIFLIAVHKTVGFMFVYSQSAVECVDWTDSSFAKKGPRGPSAH